MTITMDRYGADWPMVERGYRCHTHGVGRPFHSAAEAVTTMYAEADASGAGTGDQYLGEFVVVDAAGAPVGTVHDGDAVILYNFRGDRAIEISRAYEEPDFAVFDRTGPDGRPAPTVYFAGMLQYDGDALVPKQYLVEPPAIDRTMSEFLCHEGVPASRSARPRSSGTSPTSGTATDRATSTRRSRRTSRCRATTCSSTPRRR